jgi:dihydroorotase
MTASHLDLTRPDDWHVHLRDGAALESVVAHTARQFARAIVMPNLRPPVTTTAQALAYKARILAALEKTAPQLRFEPLMTLYLTDATPPDEVKRAVDAGIVAFKLYPTGATTNSDSGVSDVRHCYPTLEAMARAGMLLLIHGEVTDASVDVFDREAVFVERTMIPLKRDLPGLKVVFEHITTQEAADFVMQADARTAATITPQHLLYNRNAIFTGGSGTGLRPHFYCLPPLKRERHRQALLKAATSGSPKFFLGTDSAPHASVMKEASVCGAGCFTAMSAMELYAEAFDSVGALDKLEAFSSFNGADFYGLPRNTERTRLLRAPQVVPDAVPFGDALLKPLRAGETLDWRLEGSAP